MDEPRTMAVGDANVVMVVMVDGQPQLLQQVAAPFSGNQLQLPVSVVVDPPTAPVAEAPLRAASPAPSPIAFEYE
jgi:hypothetical protein